MQRLLVPMKLDLNLLVVFVQIYQERSVSRAASNLDLGQPAVSSSLAKLRKITGDRLFIRCRHGVTPTPQAEELFTTIQPALLVIARALNSVQNGGICLVKADAASPHQRKS